MRFPPLDDHFHGPCFVPGANFSPEILPFDAGSTKTASLLYTWSDGLTSLDELIMECHAEVENGGIVRAYQLYDDLREKNAAPWSNQTLTVVAGSKTYCKTATGTITEEETPTTLALVGNILKQTVNLAASTPPASILVPAAADILIDSVVPTTKLASVSKPAATLALLAGGHLHDRNGLPIPDGSSSPGYQLPFYLSLSSINDLAWWTFSYFDAYAVHTYKLELFDQEGYWGGILGDVASKLPISLPKVMKEYFWAVDLVVNPGQ